MTTDEKNRWMAHALELARRGWGTTHPNPMVGAVIVDRGEIVAEGWHEVAGGAHAEAAAVEAAGGGTRSDTATLFVTLEPCSTEGRTPACTDAIIRSGIKQVVVGTMDPNPAHAGAGLQVLRDAGITVETGILEEDCEDLNLIFNHWITERMPFIAAKVATSIDGCIAARTGDSKWITGEDARRDVMRWRRYFPAIAVGADTVLTDNPRLTSRMDDEEEWCPIRFVFDGRLRTVCDPLPAIYTDEFHENTIVVTSEGSSPERRDRLVEAGVRGWSLPAGDDGVLPGEFRHRCAELEIEGVLVEGGAGLLSSLIAHDGIDYLLAYRAPVFFADDEARRVFGGREVFSVEQAYRLRKTRHAIFGDDQLIRGHVV